MVVRFLSKPFLMEIFFYRDDDGVIIIKGAIFVDKPSEYAKEYT
jgi:hypothetical protein